jgi:hypothetical protein
MVATIQDFQSTQKNILQGIIQMVQWFQRRKITYLSSHKVLCKTMSYGGVHLEFLIHTKNMIKAMERLFVYNLGLIKVCTFEKNYSFCSFREKLSIQAQYAKILRWPSWTSD